MNKNYLVIAGLIIGLMVVPSTTDVFADSVLYKAQGRSAGPEINSNKVCGAQLCNASGNDINISTPDYSRESFVVSSKNLALTKALETDRVVSILKNYYAYKGISFIDGYSDAMGIKPVEKAVPEKPQEKLQLTVPQDKLKKITPKIEIYEGGLYANPDFVNPAPTKSTVMKEEKSEKEFEIVLPSWVKSDYTNPDFPVHEKPVYVPEIIEVPVTNSTAPVNATSSDMVPSFGMCGAGTVLINGVCTVADQE